MYSVAPKAQLWSDHRTEPEASYLLDAYREEELYPVTVHIAKVGGGTPGVRYSGKWLVEITHNGDTVLESADLYTGTPADHFHAAQIAATFIGY